MRLLLVLTTLLLLTSSYHLSPQSALQDSPEGETTPLRRTFEELDLSGAIEESFLKVPRLFFLPETLSGFASKDQNVPIASGAMVPGFTTVSRLFEALSVDPNTLLLVYGRAGGFFASVAATVAEEVHLLELLDKESKKYPEIWQDLGLTNISLVEEPIKRNLTANAETASPSGGVESGEEEGYDAILFHAGSRRVPARFLSLLEEGGRLAVPLTDPQGNQVLTILRKSGTSLSIESAEELYFPPNNPLFKR